MSHVPILEIKRKYIHAERSTISWKRLKHIWRKTLISIASHMQRDPQTFRETNIFRKKKIRSKKRILKPHKSVTKTCQISSLISENTDYIFQSCLHMGLCNWVLDNGMREVISSVFCSLPIMTSYVSFSSGWMG